jgi:hypothetical protein
MNNQQNNPNQIKAIVDLLKNSSYSEIKYFFELLKTIENSAEKYGFYEAIIFSLLIQIKNYEIFFEQLKQNKIRKEVIAEQ